LFYFLKNFFLPYHASQINPEPNLDPLYQLELSSALILHPCKDYLAMPRTSFEYPLMIEESDKYAITAM
jgi:hypothetical protein